MSLSRRLFDVGLEPAVGSRLQPTGFPDIGAATFKRPVRDASGQVQWTEAVLVESEQSMANHLEATAWPRGATQPVEVLRGLPYVRVVTSDGEFLTSSRLEAHRLASAWVKDAHLNGQQMREVLKQRLDLRDDTPLSPRHIARTVFEMDPLCLVHGVFFSDRAWPGQPKIARALTGFVEAVDVAPVHTGGVKRDHVRHSLEGATGGTAEGYGTVPFHRTEYTAAEVVASFALDRDQIAAYGLPEPAGDLIETLALWELRSLLDGSLRLRTACDLLVVDEEITDRDGEPLPSREDLDGRVRSLIQECRDLLGDGQPIEVVWGE